MLSIDSVNREAGAVENTPSDLHLNEVNVVKVAGPRVSPGSTKSRKAAAIVPMQISEN